MQDNAGGTMRMSVMVAACVLASSLAAAQRGPVADVFGPTMVVDYNQRVPMRDGIELSADVFRPRADGRYPVILLRTPYLKSGRNSTEQGRAAVARGYVYIAMDVRGRGESQGDFMPYQHDGKDGYDAIEWAARQPWSTGKVGTIGKSYDAGVEWLAAIQQPPHLVAMVSLATVGDPGTDIFNTGPTGVPTPTMISWYHLVAGHGIQDLSAVDWSALAWHLPLNTMDDVSGRPLPYWKEHLNHPGSDPWWDSQRYQTRYADITVPVLHITGWYDDVQGVTLKNFAGMTTAGHTNQKLIVGPWPHAINRSRKLGDIDFGPTAVIDLDGSIARWFDYWLKGTPNGVMTEPVVKLFHMGDNAWADEAEWPIKRTQYTRYFLHSGGHANSLYGDGALSTTAPSSHESPDKFTYDPADPVPFITEPTFAQLGGPDDYRPVERRDDVLVYTSEPVTDATLVCGPIRVQLQAASSGHDTDFTAKFLDVSPDGFAQRLSDGVVRGRYRDGMNRPSPLEPGKAYTYDIDLWNTCESFAAGHRFRVEIASSAFPKYDRNLNTGEPVAGATRMVVASQTIYHDAAHLSSIVLPIVPNAR
jgi:putative CocE/NonD family hydrolase